MESVIFVSRCIRDAGFRPLSFYILTMYLYYIVASSHLYSLSLAPTSEVDKDTLIDIQVGSGMHMAEGKCSDDLCINKIVYLLWNC